MYKYARHKHKCKHADTPRCDSNIQIYMHIYMHIYKYSNVQIYTCTIIQIFRCTNMQCTNINEDTQIHRIAIHHQTKAGNTMWYCAIPNFQVIAYYTKHTCQNIQQQTIILHHTAYLYDEAPK